MTDAQGINAPGASLFPAGLNPEDASKTLDVRSSLVLVQPSISTVLMEGTTGLTGYAKAPRNRNACQRSRPGLGSGRSTPLTPHT